MKLALIRQRYTPYGGAERFVERAARVLAGQLSVTLFARQWSAQKGVHVVRCDPFYMGRLWRDWGFARAVCAALQDGEYDVIQSHERISCCDVYRAGDGVHASWLERRARARPLLNRILDCMNPYHRYVLRAERRLFASPRLRAVICNSTMVRDEIRDRFGVDEARLHVIHNGVDLDHFHPSLRDRHRARMRRDLGLEDDAMVLLFVGSGFERKGLGVLIRAMALSADHRWRLIVVGSDRSEQRMRGLASRLKVENKITFAGAQDDVRPWYGCADVFVLPTLYDPFPNAALEALACGIPVVTTGASGASEAIVPGENGDICQDPLSTEELLRRLVTVMSGASGMRLAARRSAEAYCVSDMARRLADLYLRLSPSRP